MTKAKQKTNPFSLGVFLKEQLKQTAILLRCIPSTVVTLFVVSVICMNILANKTLVQLDWIALDGGILIFPAPQGRRRG